MRLPRRLLQPRTLRFFLLSFRSALPLITLGAFVAGSTVSTTPAHAQLFLKGKSTVSDSGSFSYELPIPAIPGVAGMQPSLSLTYSAGGGNGLFGLGWSVSGLSSVARCPGSWAQDGRAANGRTPVGIQFNSTTDQLCLDGQRLFPVPATSSQGGTELRTEFEGFSRIIAFGADWKNPDWIQVEAKSGLISVYGDPSVSPNSRLDATVGVHRQWALSSVRDRFNNKMILYYLVDGGTPPVDFRPDRIEYTWSPDGSAPSNNSTGANVKFNYQSSYRNDVSTKYVWGARTISRYLVDSIETNLLASGSPVTIMRYKLNYSQVPSSNGAVAAPPAAVQQSILKSVTVCARPTSTATPSGKCLPPVAFTYSGQNDAISAGSGLTPGMKVITSDTVNINWTDRVFPADFAGEGIDSLLVVAGPQCATSCWQGWKWLRWSDAANKYYVAASDASLGWLNSAKIIVGDFAGTGRPGFMIYGAYGNYPAASPHYVTYFPTATGFAKGPEGDIFYGMASQSSGSTTAGGDPLASVGSNENVYAGDFFGDGRISILTNSKSVGASGSYCTNTEFSNTCSYWNAWGYAGWRLFRFDASNLTPSGQGFGTATSASAVVPAASGTTGLSYGHRAIVARFTGERASQILVTVDPNAISTPDSPLGACNDPTGWKLYNFNPQGSLTLINSG